MKKILIVDDEENIRFMYKELLRLEGYKVAVAEDAVSAIAFLKKKKVDLVVLDISMPGISGLDIIRDIRELDRNIKIIINTAYGEYKQDFSTWCADSYIIKSSDMRQLTAKISELID